MYKGLAIIFGLYFLGELIVWILGIPIPGSVLGMILLVSFLLSESFDLEDVESEAEFFVDNMSIMFIPPAVGIIVYWELVEAQIIAIFGTLVLSFFITFIGISKVMELIR